MQRYRIYKINNCKTETKLLYFQKEKALVGEFKNMSARVIGPVMLTEGAKRAIYD